MDYLCAELYPISVNIFNMAANRYIKVAYQMLLETPACHKTLYEASAEQPDQFVSGMGMMIDAFEQKVLAVEEGGNFDFVLQPGEAFGERDEHLVMEIAKKTFEVNGRFDADNIYDGAQVPLANEAGDRFFGTIVAVKDTTVIVDLNDPLAGKPLRFVGQVIENREPTLQEIERTTQILSGEGCECGCGCGCGEEHDHECHCGHHHDEGHCCHHHE